MPILQVDAANVFSIMLAAVGGHATELVTTYTKSMEERVRNLATGVDIAAGKEVYDENGPDFTDPFDAEDYPQPEGECAQQ